ncbi:molecular chaperone HtpG [Fusobacterium mortiferum]|jgi:molecular chaperone HtpG|uniref:molecular chaperone HtpG n=1 Tax=Fusobacterium mortiferum TaxID=850 RepID=UPI000E4304E6|nr:molecular chaperone HtpG [Fusobacterium mortiferum]MCF2699793.1 molecular chaperone HtpG [Fusobacterium mortiferum]MCI6382197.1 molecular chaperone HtpG [Fusobacterium mortiferum]MCI7665462.1 molecular chaperone HtpG [Fusobacterium mortiferum]MDD7261053.1 molecular chaperone HtpG [Fusobacterium mortiferum]MDY5979890.1 molecular chaperone HtpG [Fusobacterium mortiferum]
MRKEAKMFQAETKELLNLMIHSIYTNREIFLRELISNASDAIDKIKFEALTNSEILGEDRDFKITLSVNKDKKEITITDNGIGMTYDEVAENIGTIAKSGSKAFKEKLENTSKDDIDIIGQFGVGFYSGFMVADKMTLITKSPKSDMGVKWTSTGDGSYEIEEFEKKERGTSITLTIKDGEEFMTFLEDWKIRDLVKKYSDYVRYPIIFNDETINSTKPIWKTDKSQLKDENYNEFYKSTFHDWEDPMFHFHLKVQGSIEYTALLYIPKKAPMDFYSKDYKKGLQLYTKNVFIMDKCDELIPEYFSFVKGLVDCDDLSLNISREILQQNSELTAISKNLEKKIISELEYILKNDREKYIEFWEAFGRNIKFGIHDMFGMNKDKLQNLLIFRSSLDDKYVTLKEYVERMGEEKKEILYVVGEDLATVKSLPKMEALKEKGIEVLILTDKIDEFALKTMNEFEGKTFKSISDSDFKLEENKEKEEEIKKLSEDNKSMLDKIKESLTGKIVDVELSNNLGSGASALLAKGEISLEMEKVLSQIPGNENIKAEKILALNPEHPLFAKLQECKDTPKFDDLLDILYTEALMLEGFQIENPVEFIKKLNNLLK